MRSAAQNLRTAVAMAVDGKSRAALFRVFCSRFRSPPPPPPVLQSRVALFRGFCSTFCSYPLLPLSDGGAAPAFIVPPPDLPPLCNTDFEVGDSRLLGFPLCGSLFRYSDPANNSELISLADYCVQQISQIQNSQYKLVKILEAEATLVAGLRIRITLELSNQDGLLRKYRFEVWEQPWLKLRELLSCDPVK